MNNLPPLHASPVALATVVRLAERSTAAELAAIAERLRRLTEPETLEQLVARNERIDNGLECCKCGNRDPESLTSDDPCRVPVFKCLRCYASWFDNREREGDAQCDRQFDDEAAGL